MTRNDSRFIPDWFEGALPSGSFRSLFKWGNPAIFKHPNRGLYNLMKETFGMSDADFKSPRRLGLEIVEENVPIHISEALQEQIIGHFGSNNVHSDTCSRVRASYGKGCIDSMRLREHILENLPDMVIDPSSREDVEWTVQFCQTHRIPLYVFGGGSSVTRGMEAVKGGLTLDMSVHMNRLIRLNEVDQTVEVEAGMWGPQLENLLQHAPEKLNAARRYTAGHFPQSFEYSSVGGWVVTRGAGQNSTYYGKIEDIVVAQEYITPQGALKTGAYPRCATGPDFNQIMMGSEGTFGVLVSVTLRLRRWMPENQR